MDPQRGRQIGQVVLEARLVHVVVHVAIVPVPVARILRHAVQGQHRNAVAEPLVATDRDASLHRGHVLGHVEAEAAEIAEGAAVLAVDGRLDGVGAVFDDHQFVDSGEANDRRHVTGAAGEMDRDDSRGCAA